MKVPDLKKLGLCFLKWSSENPYPPIPSEVGREGAGENRVPFAHLANSVPTYLYFLDSLLANKFVVGVLDVGTGTGRNLAFVKSIITSKQPSRKNFFVGIDYSKACIEYAKNSYSTNNSIEFIQHSGKRFPFPDCTFDSIVSSHVLEHIAEDDAGVYFKEIYRVLKPGGFAILGTPNRKYCQDLFCINPSESRKYRLILPHLREYYYAELKEVWLKKFWKGRFEVYGTTNLLCRELMVKSIDNIKPGKSLIRKFIFYLYTIIRQNPKLQAFVARLGTEFVMRGMKINYKKLVSSTHFDEKNIDNSDNLLLFLRK